MKNLIFDGLAVTSGRDNCSVRRDKQHKKSLLRMDCECAFIWFIINVLSLTNVC